MMPAKVEQSSPKSGSLVIYKIVDCLEEVSIGMVRLSPPDTEVSIHRAAIELQPVDKHRTLSNIESNTD